MENNKTEVGAAWRRERSNGEGYMTIKITVNGKPLNFIAYKNRNKTHEKQPDIIIYEDEWRKSGKQSEPKRRR